jgi:hypothetical protein
LDEIKTESPSLAQFLVISPKTETMVMGAGQRVAAGAAEALAGAEGLVEADQVEAVGAVGRRNPNRIQTHAKKPRRNWQK